MTPRPFVWHKSADEILDILAGYCARITGSGHRRHVANRGSIGFSSRWLGDDNQGNVEAELSMAGSRIPVNVVMELAVFGSHEFALSTILRCSRQSGTLAWVSWCRARRCCNSGPRR